MSQTLDAQTDPINDRYMNLTEFLASLQTIAAKVENPSRILVEMSDRIPVVPPVLKDDVVYITDVAEDTSSL